MITTIIVLVLWAIVLIRAFVQMYLGIQPTWLMVILPLFGAIIANLNIIVLEKK